MAGDDRRAVLQVRRVTKGFGQKTVLRDVDLTANAGDIVLLTGPNGAGKTTLLKIIAGLLHPLAGEVKHVVPRMERWFVPDEPILQGNLTVRENLMYAAMVHDVPKKEFERRTERLLRRYGLWEARDSFPDALSYGMERKASICMGLVVSPRVLLADEPFSGLDSVSLERFAEDVERISRRGGVVVISTHQFAPIEKLAHRVVRIELNRSGPPVMRNELN